MSPHIDLKECFDHFSQRIDILNKQSRGFAKKERRIAQLMGMSSDSRKTEFEQLSRDCHASLLKPKNPDMFGYDLETVILQENLTGHSQRYHRHLSSLFRWAPQPFPTLSQPLVIPQDQSSYLVTVRVFNYFSSSVSNQRLIPVMQDIQMHSKQLLTVLRDTIECRIDKTPIQGASAKDLIPSGMFFIGNTFYKDGRNELGHDYGASIEIWMYEELRKKWEDNENLKERKRRKFEPRVPYQHALMEETRIDQLGPIQMGCPYLYRHLDSCEHLIVFADARLINGEDPQSIDSYPQVKIPIPDIVYCDACSAFPSEVVVKDPGRCPNLWTHFCNDCFQSFYPDGSCTAEFHYFPQLNWADKYENESIDKQFNCVTLTKAQLS